MGSTGGRVCSSSRWRFRLIARRRRRPLRIRRRRRADSDELDGVWHRLGSAVQVETPLDGVRIFTVTKNQRFRVLVARVDASFHNEALAHVGSCEPSQWRPMNSFTTDAAKGNVAPAAYSCLQPRALAPAACRATVVLELKDKWTTVNGLTVPNPHRTAHRSAPFTYT